MFSIFWSAFTVLHFYDLQPLKHFRAINQLWKSKLWWNNKISMKSQVLFMPLNIMSIFCGISERDPGHHGRILNYDWKWQWYCRAVNATSQFLCDYHAIKIHEITGVCSSYCTFKIAVEMQTVLKGLFVFCESLRNGKRVWV